MVTVLRIVVALEDPVITYNLFHRRDLASLNNIPLQTLKDKFLRKNLGDQFKIGQDLH